MIARPRHECHRRRLRSAHPSHPKRRVETLDEELIEILSDVDGVVSIIEEPLAVAVTVRGHGCAVAIIKATETIVDAFDRLDVSLDPAQIERAEAQTVQRTRAQIDEPTFPPVVGVAEVAALLGVCKQRVFELRRAGRLPHPLAELRARPIWPRPAIERWIEGWARKPGRPKKSASG